MPPQIERLYGVPLPIDLLWSLLSDQLGAETTNELRAIYRQATRRYSRAAELNKIRRLVSYWERRGGHSRMARWRAALADPQAFIDEELP